MQQKPVASERSMSPNPSLGSPAPSISLGQYLACLLEMKGFDPNKAADITRAAALIGVYPFTIQAILDGQTKKLHLRTLNKFCLKLCHNLPHNQATLRYLAGHGSPPGPKPVA